MRLLLFLFAWCVHSFPLQVTEATECLKLTSVLARTVSTYSRLSTKEAICYFDLAEVESCLHDVIFAFNCKAQESVSDSLFELYISTYRLILDEHSTRLVALGSRDHVGFSLFYQKSLWKNRGVVNSRMAFDAKAFYNDNTAKIIKDITVAQGLLEHSLSSPQWLVLARNKISECLEKIEEMKSSLKFKVFGRTPSLVTPIDYSQYCLEDVLTALFTSKTDCRLFLNLKKLFISNIERLAPVAFKIDNSHFHHFIPSNVNYGEKGNELSFTIYLNNLEHRLKSAERLQIHSTLAYLFVAFKKFLISAFEIHSEQLINFSLLDIFNGQFLVMKKVRNMLWYDSFNALLLFFKRNFRDLDFNLLLEFESVVGKDLEFEPSVIFDSSSSELIRITEKITPVSHVLPSLPLIMKSFNSKLSDLKSFQCDSICNLAQLTSVFLRKVTSRRYNSNFVHRELLFVLNHFSALLRNVFLIPVTLVKDEKFNQVEILKLLHHLQSKETTLKPLKKFRLSTALELINFVGKLTKVLEINSTKVKFTGDYSSIFDVELQNLTESFITSRLDDWIVLDGVDQALSMDESVDQALTIDDPWNFPLSMQIDPSFGEIDILTFCSSPSSGMVTFKSDEHIFSTSSKESKGCVCKLAYSFINERQLESITKEEAFSLISLFPSFKISSFEIAIKGENDEFIFLSAEKPSVSSLIQLRNFIFILGFKAYIPAVEINQSSLNLMAERVDMDQFSDSSMKERVDNEQSSLNLMAEREEVLMKLIEDLKRFVPPSFANNEIAFLYRCFAACFHAIRMNYITKNHKPDLLISYNEFFYVMANASLGKRPLSFDEVVWFQSFSPLLRLSYDLCSVMERLDLLSAADIESAKISAKNLSFHNAFRNLHLESREIPYMFEGIILLDFERSPFKCFDAFESPIVTFDDSFRNFSDELNVSQCLNFLKWLLKEADLSAIPSSAELLLTYIPYWGQFMSSIVFSRYVNPASLLTEVIDAFATAMLIYENYLGSYLSRGSPHVPIWSLFMMDRFPASLADFNNVFFAHLEVLTSFPFQPEEGIVISMISNITLLLGQLVYSMVSACHTKEISIDLNSFPIKIDRNSLFQKFSRERKLDSECLDYYLPLESPGINFMRHEVEFIFPFTNDCSSDDSRRYSDDFFTFYSASVGFRNPRLLSYLFKKIQGPPSLMAQLTPIFDKIEESDTAELLNSLKPIVAMFQFYQRRFDQKDSLMRFDLDFVRYANLPCKNEEELIFVSLFKLLHLLKVSTDPFTVSTLLSDTFFASKQADSLEKYNLIADEFYYSEFSFSSLIIAIKYRFEQLCNSYDLDYVYSALMNYYDEKQASLSILFNLCRAMSRKIEILFSLPVYRNMSEMPLAARVENWLVYSTGLSGDNLILSHILVLLNFIIEKDYVGSSKDQTFALMNCNSADCVEFVLQSWPHSNQFYDFSHIFPSKRLDFDSSYLSALPFSETTVGEFIDDENAIVSIHEKYFIDSQTSSLLKRLFTDADSITCGDIVTIVRSISDYSYEMNENLVVCFLSSDSTPYSLLIPSPSAKPFNMEIAFLIYELTQIGIYLNTPIRVYSQQKVQVEDVELTSREIDQVPSDVTDISKADTEGVDLCHVSNDELSNLNEAQEIEQVTSDLNDISKATNDHEAVDESHVSNDETSSLDEQLEQGTNGLNDISNAANENEAIGKGPFEEQQKVEQEADLTFMKDSSLLSYFISNPVFWKPSTGPSILCNSPSSAEPSVIKDNIALIAEHRIKALDSHLEQLNSSSVHEELSMKIQSISPIFLASFDNLLAMIKCQVEFLASSGKLDNLFMLFAMLIRDRKRYKDLTNSPFDELYNVMLTSLQLHKFEDECERLAFALESNFSCEYSSTVQTFSSSNELYSLQELLSFISDSLIIYPPVSVHFAYSQSESELRLYQKCFLNRMLVWLDGLKSKSDELQKLKAFAHVFCDKMTYNSMNYTSLLLNLISDHVPSESQSIFDELRRMSEVFSTYKHHSSIFLMANLDSLLIADKFQSIFVSCLLEFYHLTLMEQPFLKERFTENSFPLSDLFEKYYLHAKNGQLSHRKLSIDSIYEQSIEYKVENFVHARQLENLTFITLTSLCNSIANENATYVFSLKLGKFPFIHRASFSFLKSICRIMNGKPFFEDILTVSKELFGVSSLTGSLHFITWTLKYEQTCYRDYFTFNAASLHQHASPHITWMFKDLMENFFSLSQSTPVYVLLLKNDLSTILPPKSLSVPANQMDYLAWKFNNQKPIDYSLLVQRTALLQWIRKNEIIEAIASADLASYLETIDAVLSDIDRSLQRLDSISEEDGIRPLAILFLYYRKKFTLLKEQGISINTLLNISYEIIRINSQPDGDSDYHVLLKMFKNYLADLSISTKINREFLDDLMTLCSFSKEPMNGPIVPLAIKDRNTFAQSISLISFKLENQLLPSLIVRNGASPVSTSKADNEVEAFIFFIESLTCVEYNVTDFSEFFTSLHIDLLDIQQNFNRVFNQLFFIKHCISSGKMFGKSTFATVLNVAVIEMKSLIKRPEFLKHYIMDGNQISSIVYFFLIRMNVMHFSNSSSILMLLASLPSSKSVEFLQFFVNLFAKIFYILNDLKFTPFSSFILKHVIPRRIYMPDYKGNNSSEQNDFKRIQCLEPVNSLIAWKRRASTFAKISPGSVKGKSFSSLENACKNISNASFIELKMFKGHMQQMSKKAFQSLCSIFGFHSSNMPPLYQDVIQALQEFSGYTLHTFSDSPLSVAEIALIKSVTKKKGVKKMPQNQSFKISVLFSINAISLYFPIPQYVLEYFRKQMSELDISLSSLVYFSSLQQETSETIIDRPVSSSLKEKLTGLLVSQAERKDENAPFFEEKSAVENDQVEIDMKEIRQDTLHNESKDTESTTFEGNSLKTVEADKKEGTISVEQVVEEELKGTKEETLHDESKDTANAFLEENSMKTVETDKKEETISVEQVVEEDLQETFLHESENTANATFEENSIKPADNFEKEETISFEQVFKEDMKGTKEKILHEESIDTTNATFEENSLKPVDNNEKEENFSMEQSAFDAKYLIDENDLSIETFSEELNDEFAIKEADLDSLNEISDESSIIQDENFNPFEAHQAAVKDFMDQSFNEFDANSTAILQEIEASEKSKCSHELENSHDETDDHDLDQLSPLVSDEEKVDFEMNISEKGKEDRENRVLNEGLLNHQADENSLDDELDPFLPLISGKEEDLGINISGEEGNDDEKRLLDEELVKVQVDEGSLDAELHPISEFEMKNSGEGIEEDYHEQRFLNEELLTLAKEEKVDGPVPEVEDVAFVANNNLKSSSLQNIPLTFEISDEEELSRTISYE